MATKPERGDAIIELPSKREIGTVHNCLGKSHGRFWYIQNDDGSSWIVEGPYHAPGHYNSAWQYVSVMKPRQHEKNTGSTPYSRAVAEGTLVRDNPRSRTKTSLPYKGDPGLRRLMRPSTSRSRRAAAAPDLDKDATYTVRGYPGIAWYTRGYVVETRQWDRYAEDEPEPEEDRSRAVMVMVGDDRKHIIDIDDLTKIGEDEYCHTCGQIGCTHNI